LHILRVENLTVEFHLEEGVLRPVDDVSFAIEPGEAFGLVGESGSGKTMTALAIIGLLDPRARVKAGRVWLGQDELLSKSDRELESLRGRRVSMVFQEPMTSLNPAYSLGEQVAEVYQYHLQLGRADSKRRATEMLERVKIPRAREMYDKYPHELSGGMRQRVMIAMALACKPDLVIADEPTTALDVTIQAQILALLEELQNEMRMALLLISHNLEVVAQVCGRVAVMYAGRLVEIAETAALFERPAHPYTEGLVQSIPHRGQALRAIPGTVCDLLAVPTGCRFHPRCRYAQERCVTDVPLLAGLNRGSASEGGGRLVACHFPLADV
jgi:oligopeptide transport system ATP-binding protein